MRIYRPYLDNPKSVINWLSSHMALQYNWQIFVICICCMPLSIALFYINFPSLTPNQNLIFHTLIFIVCNVVIVILACIRFPHFVHIQYLSSFKKENTNIFGTDIVSIIYYYLNFNNNELNKNLIQSEKTPIDLLAMIENRSIVREAYQLIEKQGGIQPRLIEPFSIFLFLFLIFFQWFFLVCLLDNNFKLIYEPAWLISLNNWLMRSTHFMPIVGKGGWMLIDITDFPELFINVTTVEDVLSNQLLKSTVLYNFLQLIAMPLQLFCLYQILFFRRNLVAYDKLSILYSTSFLNFFKRLFISFLMLPIAFGIIVISYSGIEFTSLPNVLARSAFGTIIFILLTYHFLVIFLFLITDIVRFFKLK